MRRFILNALVFLLFSALFSIGVIFLPPSHWDAIVVLFSVLIFLNKKPALVFSLALIAGLFFEMISNTNPGIQIIALFASLVSAYLLKNHLLKLNRQVAFLLNIANTTAVYRLSQIIVLIIFGGFSSGFFQAVYDLTDMRLFLFALIWNVCLSVLFIILYNAARKRFFERFFIFR